MSYLVCDKCGGYYELQEGENPDEFTDKCECGGELQYKKSFKSDNSKRKIDIKALIIGILITSFLVSFSYIGGKYYFISYSAPFVGGFLTAYIANGSRKNRIFHSVVVMLIVSIGAPLLALLRTVILFPDKTSQILNLPGIEGFIIFIIFIAFMFTLILIYIFIGTVMGYLATIIKKKAS